tara:strand:- start:4833 stop:5186 length:354 start_codon:yes stop_codon:yes gene_type:complete
MKSIIASGLLLGMAHGAAIAGPYVNVENNAGFTGTDFNGHQTDFHVGYEAGNEVGSWGVQGGPSVVSPDNEESDTILTGKVFGSASITEKLGVYGELSAAFDDVNSYGTKAGIKYSF